MNSLPGAALYLPVLFVAQAACSQFQFGADWKISGKAYESFQARTYQSHARDYAHMVYYEGRGEQPLRPQVAREHVASIRKNVAASNQALDKVKQAHADQPSVVKAVDEIKEKHAAVTARCDEMDKHLAGAPAEPDTICDHCHDAISHLDAASSATDKLLKDLDLHKVPRPAKSTDSPSTKK
ncbi:MAG: hypothetical protein ACT4QC_07900 [Planctomycetaceae bacterium]